MNSHGRLIAPDTLEFHRTFDATPEKVWSFLVDPDKRRLWFCGGSTDDHVGGRIVLEFDHRRLSDSPPPAKYAGEDVALHEGVITAFEPSRRLAFTWAESAGTEHSTVEITLRPAARGGTELQLIHRGIVGRDTLVGSFAGWHGHFDLLGEVLVGVRKTDFWLRDQELEAEYDEHLASM